MMKHCIAIALAFLLVACGKPEQPTKNATPAAAEATAKQPWEMDIRNEATDITNSTKDKVIFLTTESEGRGKSVTKKTESKPVKQELHQPTRYDDQTRQRGVMSYAEATQQRPDLFYDTGKYDSRDANAYQARANYQYQNMAEREQQTALQLQRNQQNFEREMQARQAEMQRERERRKQELIKEISKPIPGSKSMTRSQREAIVSIETGQPMPSHNDSYGNNNSQNNTPKYTSNCDGSGCWGTDGTRYNNSGTGDYYSSDGKFCQNIGGQMHCH